MITHSWPQVKHLPIPVEVRPGFCLFVVLFLLQHLSMAGKLNGAHFHPWASPCGALKLCVVEVKLLGSEKHLHGGGG